MDENWSQTRRDDNSWMNTSAKNNRQWNFKKTAARRDVAISVLGMNKLHQNNLQEGAETLRSHSNQIKSLILTDFAGCL